MKTSNTKISKEQKAELSLFKATFPEARFFSYPIEGVTMLMVPEFEGSKMVALAVSTMSENERKCRIKVGQYYAWQAWCNGQVVKLAITAESYGRFSNNLAYMVSIS